MRSGRLQAVKLARMFLEGRNEPDVSVKPEYVPRRAYGLRTTPEILL